MDAYNHVINTHTCLLPSLHAIHKTATHDTENTKYSTRQSTHNTRNQQGGEGGEERDSSLARPALMPLAFAGDCLLGIVKCIVKMAHVVTAEGAIRMCKMRDCLLPLSRQGCTGVLRVCKRVC